MLAATKVNMIMRGREKKKVTGPETHTTFAPKHALLGSF